MKISVMNGFNRINARIDAPQGQYQGGMNGSRIDFDIEGDQGEYIANGATLDDYMNGYTLNGFTLNALGAMDEADYQLLKLIVQDRLQAENIDPGAMQGLTLAAIGTAARKTVNAIKDGVAAGKAAVSAIKQNVAERRGQELVSSAQSPDGVRALDEFQMAVGEEFSADQRLFSSKPSLFKEPGKWFSSKKVPTIQKVLVVGGGVVLIDALTGGNNVLKRSGIMKSKKRR